MHRHLAEGVRPARPLPLAERVRLPAAADPQPQVFLACLGARRDFGPREQFTFDLEPLLAGVEPSTTIDIATTLTPARGRATLWSTQQRLPVPVDGPAIATLHVPMPAQEGVYEIRLAVTRPPGFRGLPRS